MSGEYTAAGNDFDGSNRKHVTLLRSALELGFGRLIRPL